MNKNSLGNKIRREIIKSPKKAIFLGVLTVVTLYFWVPLLVGHASSGKEDMAQPVEAQTAANTSSPQINLAENATANKERKNTRPTWKEIVKWTKNDPRTQPAELLAISQDPFQDRTEIVEKPVVEEKVEVKPPTASPTSLGMALTSTIFGTQNGVARIGGKTYAQGQKIKVEKEGQSYEFLLTEIRDRQVILETDGEKFELNIPDPGKSNRMVFGTGR